MDIIKGEDFASKLDSLLDVVKSKLSPDGNVFVGAITYHLMIRKFLTFMQILYWICQIFRHFRHYLRQGLLACVAQSLHEGVFDITTKKDDEHSRR